MSHSTPAAPGLSPPTVKKTSQWPPTMFALLHRAVHSEDPAVRERALMRLLDRYTRELDNEPQRVFRVRVTR